MKGGTVAVLDVGKSDVKLSASTNEGHVLETLTLPNRVLPGPPWQHHDLAAWRVALNWLALNYPVDLTSGCPSFIMRVLGVESSNTCSEQRNRLAQDRNPQILTATRCGTTLQDDAGRAFATEDGTRAYK